MAAKMIYSGAVLVLAINSAQAEHRFVGCAPISVPGGQIEIGTVNRLTWGDNDSVLRSIARTGLRSFLDDQLHPSPDDGLPEAVRSQIAALDVEQNSPQQLLGELRGQQQMFRTETDAERKDQLKHAIRQRANSLARQAAIRSLLRDIYSKNQLREQMTWFWFNHFNVAMGKPDVAALIADYEEHAIRPHVFGHFRDLLSASLHHPAMLLYLDNAQNFAGHINENYAREIMELHTLGVNGGYSQKDVEELARIMTGAGVDRAGNFDFQPARHDNGSKLFLGHKIEGGGLDEIETAIDILSRHPSTARFLSRKLAIYFVSDAPTAKLVDEMSKTFDQTDGDIAAVLGTMLSSREFEASLGTKFKDPLHFIVSAIRAAYGDDVIGTPGPVMTWLYRLGESPYGHQTPDGYPIVQAPWSGSGDMGIRFEFARALGSRPGRLFETPPHDAVGRASPDIAHSYYFSAVAPMLSASTVHALAQASSTEGWNMLYLSSPEFMHR